MHIGHKSYITPCAVPKNGIANLIQKNSSTSSGNKPNRQIPYIGFNLNTTNIYFSKRRKHDDN
jgi:hypothetical protein